MFNKREVTMIECKRPGCGKRFRKTHYAQRFCSAECRGTFHNDNLRRFLEAGRKLLAENGKE